MSLDPALTGTPGALPLTVTAPTPKNGELVRAEDVQEAVQPLLNMIATLEARARVHGRTFYALDNNGSSVYAGQGIIVVKDFTFSALVPTGGSGTTTGTLWTTPSVPFVIDTIALLITGTATGSGNPASVQLLVNVGTIDAIVGVTSAWGGTSYTLNGTTNRPRLFGLAAGDKGTLFTPPAGDGTDDLGYAVDGTTGAVWAAADGGSQGLWGKNVTLNVTHGAIGGVTLTIPLRLMIRGHIL